MTAATMTRTEYDAFAISDDYVMAVETDSGEVACACLDVLLPLLDDLDKFALGHGNACAADVVRELLRSLTIERPALEESLSEFSAYA